MNVQDSTSAISVVIPAYNEEAYVEKSVRHAEAILRGVVSDFEIIVVDDGSTDRTRAILEGLKISRPHLIILHHQQNRGLGSALCTGFAACRKPITFYSDADLPFDFREVARALHVIEFKDADVVSGFRHARTAEGLHRTLCSLGYNLMIRILFGVRVRDINFSFKMIRTALLRQMDLCSQGSFIDAELTIRADRMGAFTCQIGLDYFPRKYGGSNLSGIGTILMIVREMVQHYAVLRRVKPVE